MPLPHRIRQLISPLPPSPGSEQLDQREAERARLLEELPAGGICAEVGTWKGDFAAIILEHRSPERLYLIDPWAYSSEQAHDQASDATELESAQQALDDMLQSVIGRFEVEIDEGHVVVMRQRPTDAAATFAPDSLDWVYIDGDHSYDGVKADLDAYFATVRPGGYLAGDDYGDETSSLDGGVKGAVDEFALRCGGLQVIGTQFMLRKPE